MRTKKHIVLISGLIVASTAFLTSEALAQGHRFGPGGGHGWLRAVKSLDLSQTQVQKIAQARADMIEKTAPVHAQIEVKAMELRTLWQSKSPSRQAIIAKHNEIDALHRQIRDARIGFKLAVFGVLTPAQRTTLNKRLAEMPPRGMGKGRGRGGPGGPGGPGKGWGGGRGRGRGWGGGWGGGPSGGGPRGPSTGTGL